MSLVIIYVYFTASYDPIGYYVTEQVYDYYDMFECKVYIIAVVYAVPGKPTLILLNIR